METSDGVAAWTEQMGSSVLRRVSSGYQTELGMSYVGFTVVNVCPLLLGTNSLLMKSPVGCTQVLPFGAVSLTSGAPVEWALPLRCR